MCFIIKSEINSFYQKSSSICHLKKIQIHHDNTVQASERYINYIFIKSKLSANSYSNILEYFDFLIITRIR